MRRSLVPAIVFLMAFAGCNSNKTAKEPAAAPAQPTIQVDAATAGLVRGTVHFDGVAPKPQPIDNSVDPACRESLATEQVVVNDGRLANVLVYVKEGLNGVTPPPAEAAVIDQRGCRYLPHVLGVVAGQTVRILNSDPTTHNVHPAPEQNRKWNQSQQAGAEPITRQFPTPELMVPVKCNVHPWMKMWVHVLPHRFFAVTGERGEFAIEELPPGEYTLAALHETLGEQTFKLTVGAKSASNVSFRYKSGDAAASERK